MSRRNGQLLTEPSTSGSRTATGQVASEATLHTYEVVAMTVGIVIVAGICRAPSLVAAYTANTKMMVLAWVLGGGVSLIGALCYAELATAYPHTGGDYHYLRRAFGARLSFLFAWARLSVIQTGSMALLAFVFGDYAGVEHGEVQIHLSGPSSTNKRQTGQGGIYIFCDDVDAYHAEITARGAVAQAAPKDYEYGMRDFVITDPDGNLLGFGQECGSG